MGFYPIEGFPIGYNRKTQDGRKEGIRKWVLSSDKRFSHVREWLK